MQKFCSDLPLRTARGGKSLPCSFSHLLNDYSGAASTIFSMSAIDEVKARLDIVDVIGAYVKLTRSGKNYKGLSPFQSERTPSFFVSQDRQSYKDFFQWRGG